MDIQDVLRKHGRWLKGEAGGEKADLRGAKLSEADLSEADLRWADLREADLREADLRWADLRWAKLSGAKLSEADLREADLHWADLHWAKLSGAKLDQISNMNGAIGNMREIKSMQLDTWPVTYTATHMQIGCQLRLISDWFGFSDEQIAEMDISALAWWKKWKPILKQIIDASPATEGA